ncbi:alpha-L-fucosidase [Arachidicoccus terrestris]|uniref:alpha-L-fucosidase n=1 Tax=Arachidicoccus terrestris TaxID=2875539 RepID=UPI001CC37C17|nr:alpha-L-fucosidase [Arachidicoccus terrestris]UAY54106.1 alpha-L-fucosidase [Arachidicoccus terrestris]
MQKKRSYANTRSKLSALILGIAMAGSACTQKAPPPPAPYGALPTQNQLDWQENNIYAFIHFGINTFTDKEWGYGDEDPALFNPKDFDADQIVKSIAQGGFKGIVLTCKHHDGFCLWPTKTTTHNITKSPFRDGKGDLVKEIEQACRKYGLKFGVYLSPWDRNASSYGSQEYVKMYRAQLTELLTQYGDIFEIWHDGANGGDGYYGGARERRNIDRSTYYNWPSVWALERKLQPKALIFGDIGADLRWVGNERGYAGDPCWQTFTPVSNEPGKAPSNGTIKSELSTNGTRNGKFWMPAEVDFSIRPGWFWHASQNDQVRTALNLWDHYFLSAGRGASMLLNIPPDKNGLVYKTDSIQLKVFGDILKETFSRDLAKGATATASNIRGEDQKDYGTQHLFDGDQFSYWATDDAIHTPEVTIQLKGEQTFDIIRLKENTKLGQRIDSLEVDGWLDGSWKRLAGANSIGSNRLIRLPAKVTTEKLRIRIIAAPVCPALSDVSLFSQPLLVAQLQKETQLAQSTKKAVNQNWKVIEPGGANTATILDDQPATVWQSTDAGKENKTSVVLDAGSGRSVLGLNYLPPGNSQGAIDKYNIYVKGKGEDWQKVAGGEFSNIKANPVVQTVHFSTPVNARYIKLEALHTVDGKPAAIADLNILEQ